MVECHYTQTSLLPHLDCVLDSTDNVCRARPPLPSLQYNLLHQKLSLLNCCIEEKRNNSHNDDLSESDDDDPIYFDQYQTPLTDESLSPNPQTPIAEADVLSPTVNQDPLSPTMNHDPLSPTMNQDPLSPTMNQDPLSPPISTSGTGEEHATPSVKVPLGKGIYNWSGWYLLGSHEPCWIPITKDKDILTVLLPIFVHY